MYVITSIVCVLYCFDLFLKSFRILIYNLNNANVSSSSFIISSVLLQTQKQTCISSRFFRNTSFYRIILSRIFNLTDFVTSVFFICFICSKIFFDNTFRSIFSVHTCFSLYLIHVWMLNCDAISSSVRFSLRILFWSLASSIT